MEEPSRSPLYEAQNAQRYERQLLIREYEESYSCRLAVVIDTFFSRSITLFEEVLYDADPEQPLHVLLSTPGGDGETALRLIRQAQFRCSELTVIVPDQAKSAGTLFALGADKIFMGPTSDLGPVDPQFLLSGSLAAGKAIIAAVEEAERRVQENPRTYPLHASLLGDITALMVQQARDALERAEGQLHEALACVSSRTEDAIKQMVADLRGPLLDDSQSHGATISTREAIDLGLPVEEASPANRRWKHLWRLWAKYAALNAEYVYEGTRASHVKPYEPAHPYWREPTPAARDPRAASNIMQACCVTQ